MEDRFSKIDRDRFYHLIAARRDIRQFTSKPVPLNILKRMIWAAHHAPSVGFMQPWNFIIIESLKYKQRVKSVFEKMNQQELKKITDSKRRALYSKLKLEGIMEAPMNLAITCDRYRDAPFVLGRGTMRETDLFSVCLAIQNMWLAARVEGIGIGWVSIMNRRAVERILHLPKGIRLVAYLCIGYPTRFDKKPMLQKVGWKQRLNLNKLVFYNRWGNKNRSI